MASIYYEGIRAGYYFREFIDLLQKASLTLKVETDPLGTGNKEEVRFNYFATPGKFKTALSSSFTTAFDELDNTLLQNYEKLKKLDFITRYLTEIAFTEQMISESENGVINHQEFAFLNISEEDEFKSKILTIINAQDFLRLQKIYLFKSKYYLSGLHDNIKSTSQNDFELPYSMIPNPNDATKENPISYFEYLICKNGIIVLRNEFVPTEDDHDHMDYVSYNAETEIKCYADIDGESGEWIEHKIKFSDVLLNKLLIEYSKCKTLIDQHVNELEDEKSTNFFFKLTLGKLRFLLGTYEQTASLQKYTDVPKAIRGLIKYCYEKYESFCPDPQTDKILIACLKDSKLYQLQQPPILLQIAPPRPGVFIWKDPSTAARLTTVLHTGLNTFYINDIELTAFSQAFDGGNPEVPLGIKWIDQSRSGTVNKVTLLYLFKRLEEKALIECQYGSEMFLRKLEFVFKDAEGKTLKNWPQSLRSVAKGHSTPVKKIIDQLVSKMADEKTV